VHSEDAPPNNSSYGKIVKHVSDCSPYTRSVVLAYALSVKAIHLRDLPGLVISPQESDAVGMADFQANEKGNGLDRLSASVDIIAEEQVVGMGKEPADVEKLEKVGVLTMNIADHRYGRVDRFNVGFQSE
jgi:hypothetical protein